MTNRKDIVVQKFESEQFGQLHGAALIVIYKNPDDYPGKYVARLWDIDKPTPFVVLADTLEGVRIAADVELMSRFERDPYDHPCIVESWV